MKFIFNRGRRARRAFTMIEIAIALAVIGFALVAIIGILPSGLQVQRDNRTETIINQDGTFWMDAIRNGAQGLDDLPLYVEKIVISNILTGVTDEYPKPGFPLQYGSNIIGLLTTQAAITNLQAQAFVYSISGSAAEKEPNPADRELAFKYLLTVDIERGTNSALSFTTLATNFVNIAAEPLDSLYELRLTLSYPIVGDKPAPRRQVYRSTISRNLVATDFAGVPHYFFTQ